MTKIKKASKKAEPKIVDNAIEENNNKIIISQEDIDNLPKTNCE